MISDEPTGGTDPRDTVMTGGCHTIVTGPVIPDEVTPLTPDQVRRWRAQVTAFVHLAVRWRERLQSRGLREPMEHAGLAMLALERLLGWIGRQPGGEADWPPRGSPGASPFGEAIDEDGRPG